MAQVTLTGISKRYGAVRAVDSLTLDIRDREFFVLLGPTGAGKTTTLRCIAGLDQPDDGEIAIAGERVNDWSAAQRDVALVFQQYSLYPNYTVRENLAFPLKSKLRNLKPQQIEERVAKAAATVRIAHLLDRRTDRLSGGEMQRVSIGRAIVREPRVFLMDEPLSNLDAKLRELLRAELKGLQQRLGTTLIFVTHDQVEAMTMGDRVGVVNKGELIQVGTPYEIYNTPTNTFVASFVGAPAINMFDVTIDPVAGTLRYASGGHPPAIIRAARYSNPKLPASGPPVGCFANAKYPTVEMPLYFPTELYLFSDGVFETRRHQDEASLDRLVDFLVAPQNGRGRTVAEIRDRTLEHLNGSPPPDDCSVLKVSLTGSPPRDTRRMR